MGVGAVVRALPKFAGETENRARQRVGIGDFLYVNALLEPDANRLHREKRQANSFRTP
jgi:hypothetical protein